MKNAISKFLICMTCLNCTASAFADASLAATLSCEIEVADKSKTKVTSYYKYALQKNIAASRIAKKSGIFFTWLSMDYLVIKSTSETVEEYWDRQKKTQIELEAALKQVVEEASQQLNEKATTSEFQCGVSG